MNKYILQFRKNVKKILTEDKNNSIINQWRNNYDDGDKYDIFGWPEEELLNKIKIIKPNKDKYYLNKDIDETDCNRILNYVTDKINNSYKCVDVDFWEIENIPDEGYVFVKTYKAPFEEFKSGDLLDYANIENYYIVRQYDIFYNKSNKEFPYKITQTDIILIEDYDNNNYTISSKPITNYFSSEMFNKIRPRLGNDWDHTKSIF